MITATVYWLKVSTLFCDGCIVSTNIIQQLSRPLLVRMIHIRDGSKVGAFFIIRSGAKERKKIVKGMKGHVVKIAHDEYGCVILM